MDQHTTWKVYNGSQVRASTSAATYDWHEDGGTTVDPTHHDIGLVFLSSDVVLSSYPAIATGPVGAPMQVVNVGRVLNGAVTNNLYEATGPIISGVSWGYPYDYAANDLIEPGDSGGPDFVAGTHTIAAVNSAESGGIEVIARVDLVASWIASQIAAHPGSTPIDAGGATDAAAGATDAGHADAMPADAGVADAPIADAASADTAAPPDAGSAQIDAAPPPPADASLLDGWAVPATDASLVTVFPTTEEEPNDTLATASFVGGATMTGALQPGTDVDWFRIVAPVGRTGIAVVASGDAVFALGTFTGTSCALTLADQTSIAVTATGVPEVVCVEVTSPLHHAQTYTVDVTR